MLARVSSSFKKPFRIFTILLLAVTLWTAYANVFSDDVAVRAMAEDVAKKHSKCGGTCKITDMRGSRGMIDESFEYDVTGIKSGLIVVVCRRKYVVIGDYTCEAK